MKKLNVKRPCVTCNTPTDMEDLSISGNCPACQRVINDKKRKLVAKNNKLLAPEPNLAEAAQTEDLQAMDSARLKAEQAKRFEVLEEAKKEAAARELARRRLLPFIKRNIPDYEPGWIHADICQRLEKFSQDIVDRKSPRLMLFLPPRHGKSEIASKNFPAWHLGRNPTHEIIQASYASDLALDFSRKVRDQIKSPAYKALFETALDRNSQALERWNTTAGGAYAAVGVRGPITGRGAHCFPAGTRVATPDGSVDISGLAAGMCVLTCNMDNGNIGKSYIVANHSHETSGLATITTTSGQRVRATRDHKFFIPTVGWVEAQYLRAGDPLALLNDKSNMRGLWHSGGDGLGGIEEETTEGQHGSVLQSPVPCERLEEEVCGPRLCEPHSRKPELSQRQILLERMQEQAQSQQEVGYENLPPMHKEFSATELSHGLLFAELCEHSSQRTNGRSREFALQRWSELRAVVSEYEASDTPEGPELLRHLLNTGEIGCSPYRPSTTGQQTREFDNDVSCLPPPAPSLALTSVSSVSFDGGGEERVYDIQVAGTGCFFAEQVLVHNCGIIDDPVKDRQDAESPALRQQIKDWYSSTFYTRLAPGGGVLIIMTRWHEDDLAGWLVSLMEEAEKEARMTGEWPEDADRWEIIRYPAIAEEDEKFRKKGEALHEARYPLPALRKIKRTLINRDWIALYQQRPVAEDGDFFKRSTFKFYNRVDRPPLDELNIYAAWDQALGKKDANDFTVCVVIGIDRDNNIWLLNLLRGKWTSLEIIDKMIDVQETWKPVLQGVEQSMIEMSIEPMLIKVMQERGAFIPYEKLKHRGLDKVARAQPIRTRIEQGKVYFPNESDASWVSPLVEEMAKFPGGVHDDQVDALAWIGQMVLIFSPLHTRAQDNTPKWMKKLRAGMRRKHSNSAMRA